MTDNENKIDALKEKKKKLEGSRNLIAGLFVLLGYYIFDSYREGIASFFYYIIIDCVRLFYLKSNMQILDLRVLMLVILLGIYGFFF